MATRALQLGFLLSGLIDPDTGTPLTGGTVEFYESGTATAKSVWTEPEKTNAYSEITLAAGGYYQIFGEGIYRVVVKRSNDTTIWTWDDIKIEYPNTNVVTITENATQSTDHDIILADTSSGNLTYTLLASSEWTHPVIVKNIGSNSVIIDGNGSETIDGSATYTITANNQAITFFNNSSNVYKANDIADSLVGVTASASEINTLDGITASTAELNILDGVTADATEINLLDGVTSTTLELNILDGVTATASEINTGCDGITNPPIGGDSTAGRVLRVLRLRLRDGTNSNTIKIETYNTFNHTAISAVDNIPVTTQTGGFTVESPGSRLRIDSSILEGNVVGVIAASPSWNTSTSSPVHVLGSDNSDDMYLIFTDNVGEINILTTVDTGDLDFIVTYLTDG